MSEPAPAYAQPIRTTHAAEAPLVPLHTVLMLVVRAPSRVYRRIARVERGRSAGGGGESARERETETGKPGDREIRGGVGENGRNGFALRACTNCPPPAEARPLARAAVHQLRQREAAPVSYTHLRAHETDSYL
eukprot:6188326-Pleurochrysis_carterae.AAC.1